MASNNTKDRPPLPATLDDVPSSSVRRRPLSSGELRDVRSLIGVAKGRRDDGRKQNGAGYGGAPPRPLAGRRVMVPVTSRAFFEGTLQPPSKEASGSAEADDAMRERIYVNAGDGKLAEMTRAEADELFDKQQHAAVKKPPKSSVKSNKNPTQASTAPKKATTIPKETSAGPMLPLMEIRETCDESGNILDSEVVNISSTMKRLGDEMKHVSDDGKELGEVLAKTLKEGAERDIVKDVHVTSEIEADDTSAPTTTAKPKPKETISDADYEGLCARLEELERLEEEDAESKRENAKSSKRLQSGGWSKGFLNAGTKKKGGKQKKPLGVKGTVGTKGKAASNGNAKPSPPAIPKSDSATAPGKTSRVSFSGGAATKIRESDTAAGTQSEKPSRVSFSGSDNVKEIPRIGQMKVPPRPTSAVTQRGRPTASFNSPTSVEVPEADPFSPAAAVPFEENVFRGVVKERSNAASAPETVGGETAPRKKLSRFAQRRLQRE